MFNDLSGRRRTSAAKWFFGVTSMLGIISASAAAQDSVQTDVQALDALLNTPVSTAAKYAQAIREVAGSVTIVTAEDIHRYGYRSIEEVLQASAGFYLTDNKQYTYIGLRGFGEYDRNNRILLLLDGHTVNEGLTGSSQIASSMVLDFSMVKRIEIVRGPASALYGTGAILAVVNVITESEDQSGIQARVGTGSAGYRETSMTGGTRLGRLRLSLSGSWDRSDGNDLFYQEYDAPATNNGIAHNLDWQERTGFYASARLGSFSLRGRYGESSKGLPTGAYNSAFNAPGSSTTDASSFVEVQYESQLSDNKHISVRTFVDDYALSGHLTPGFPARLRGHNRVVGGEAAFRWEPVPSSRLTLGVEYRNNTDVTFAFDAKTFSLLFIDQPYSVLSLYAQEDLQLTSRLSLLVGLRHDNNSITGDATTPRLALIYDPWRGSTFKAMYGQAFRAAAPIEDASQLNQTPGHLEPERLQMMELIWIQRLSAGLALTGSIYQYRFAHMIAQVPDSARPLAFENDELVRARGVELVLDARLSPGTRGFLGLSAQRTIVNTGAGAGEVLQNSPSRLLKSGFAVDVTARLTAAAELTAESSRRTEGDHSTRGALLANLNFVVRPVAFADIGLRVANLFDTRYSHPAGTELRQDAIEQDGRTWSLYVTTRF